MKDELGDRMKSHYESRAKVFLPRRSYTLIRVDGKAFHTYTKGLSSPFDEALMEDMDNTAAYLCKNIMNAKFAFVQSDEISILITDFEDQNTQSWFDNNLQKMCSVSASMATSKFNHLRFARNFGYMGLEEVEKFKLAEFDSRVFQIPQKTEVENYFIWRQQDTVRNSIQSTGQSLYSAKELHGKNMSELQEMIFQKGVNWNDFEPKFKRGRMIVKESYQKEESIRTRWVSIEVPIFTQERNFLSDKIGDNI